MRDVGGRSATGLTRRTGAPRGGYLLRTQEIAHRRTALTRELLVVVIAQICSRHRGGERPARSEPGARQTQELHFDAGFAQAASTSTRANRHPVHAFVASSRTQPTQTVATYWGNRWAHAVFLKRVPEIYLQLGRFGGPIATSLCDSRPPKVTGEPAMRRERARL